jgi:hypothetical protein
MALSCWHLRSLVLQTDGPHPFKIEKRCSKMNRKLDHKINVAIRQHIVLPVRKRKEKNLPIAPTRGDLILSPLSIREGPLRSPWNSL